MNNHQLQYILNSVLGWGEKRKLAVTEYFSNPDLSFISLQKKYCPTHKFTVSRDVHHVERIYNQAFNIINAKSL